MFDFDYNDLTRSHIVGANDGGSIIDINKLVANKISFEIAQEVERRMSDMLLNLVKVNSMTIEEKIEMIRADSTIIQYMINPEQILLDTHDLVHKL